MTDWNLYTSMLTINGESDKDRRVDQLKRDFEREAVKNPAFNMVKRNGISQRFIITRSEVPYKYKLTAFPGEELFIGDEIEAFNEHWIVNYTRIDNTTQLTGEMWLCNHLLRWQNFSSDIIEKWCVLDSGVYSTTLSGDETIKSKHKQFKLYLPLDDDTRKLYVDKRIAVDKVFDSFGHEILNVYRVTGYDSIGESYGTGGHFLMLNLESDEFNHDTDSIDNVICDFITSEPTPITPDLLRCSITGSSQIRLGARRKYTAVFYDISGEVTTEPTPVWSLPSPPVGVIITQEDGDLIITIPDEEDLFGQTLSISVVDRDGRHATDTKVISIINI